MYFFNKRQEEVRENIQVPNQLDTVLREARTQAEIDWKNFTEKEKHELLNDFHQVGKKLNSKEKFKTKLI